MTGDDELERDYTLSRQAGWFARVAIAAAVGARPLHARAAGRAGRRSSVAAMTSSGRCGTRTSGRSSRRRCRRCSMSLTRSSRSNRQDGDRVRGAAVLSALPGLGKTTIAVCYGVRYHREQIELHGPRTPEGH